MKVFGGKSACGGIAIGRIRIHRKREQSLQHRRISDIEGELSRFRRTKHMAAEQLLAISESIKEESGKDAAAVIMGQTVILADPVLTDYVENKIRFNNYDSEDAIIDARDHFAGIFAAMEDEYMRAREADIRDVAGRLLALLERDAVGDANALQQSKDEALILVAEDMTPSETVQLDKEKMLAIVTIKGSLYSHTAILARTMAIPALVQTSLPADALSVSAEEVIDGELGIVDGEEGIFYINPDDKTVVAMREKQKRLIKSKEQLNQYRGKSKDDLIKIYANIGSLDDVSAVIENDAAGIGLFRSEFIFMGRDSYPTEEEQFEIYRQAALIMEGKPVVIRTLDIGADKTCDYFRLDHEENPALGCRAIRLCLMRPDIFKTQLRAIFRAAAFGDVRIMYPMIISVEEIRQIKAFAAEAAAELRERGESYQVPEQGIMIETPAAALISDVLAKEVDFFSIGTNDLAQYAQALDRQNPALDEFYDPCHPAVLRMIEMTVESAHKAGIEVGICGELASDTKLTQAFIDMGIDALSVSPESVLKIRQITRR